MSDSPDALAELLEQLNTGALTRRDFLVRATALGLTLGAASTLASKDAEAAALSIVSAFGATPKVLTSWGFKVVLPSQLRGGTVAWSGTGTFGPLKNEANGTLAKFNEPGANKVRVTVTKNGKRHTAELAVVAKDVNLYARVGSTANVPADSHGCPACPHNCTGPALTGTPPVFLNGTRLLPVGSTGRHKNCCGDNTFVVTGGDAEVKFHGKPLAVKGSPTKHCGGVGKITKI